MNAWIAGVAMTPFRADREADETSLARVAIADALADAEMEAAAIDAVFVSNALGDRGMGQFVLRASPLAGRPVLNVENACASATSALLEAIAWVRAGMADRALVVGVEVLTGRVRGLLPVNPADPYAAQGLTLPGLYAMKIRAHMESHGTSVEHLAAVSVKNRANGALNPKARFRSPVTGEEVLESRTIADPITLLQCCANADGAAAAVVVGERVRPATSRPVRIAGSALGSGRPRSVVGWEETALRDTALLAYERAGIRPDDVDVAEVHDAFAAGELLAYERLGFCEPGAGGAQLLDGRFSVGGPGPAVNTSGGLLSRGHPPGATGLAQVYEIVTQLRGDAEARQVAGAQVGVVATMGGSIPQLETNACTVHVLAAG